jgi:hypothetical protein
VAAWSRGNPASRWGRDGRVLGIGGMAAALGPVLDDCAAVWRG